MDFLSSHIYDRLIVNHFLFYCKFYTVENQISLFDGRSYETIFQFLAHLSKILQTDDNFK